MSRQARIWLAATLLAAPLAGAAQVPGALRVEEQASLRHFDGQNGDGFGADVALDGNTALIGVPADGDLHDAGGAAYVFVRVGTEWEQEQKLVPAAGQPGDRFGTSVAIQSDRAFVGAPWAQGESGRVHLFERSGNSWSEVAVLASSDAAIAGRFGFDLALDGDTLAVGTRFLSKVYVFERGGSAWTQHTSFTPAPPVPGNQFGRSLALHGDLLVGGAPGESSIGGAAYVFRRGPNDWIQETKLVGTAVPNSLFGFSVSLRGDTVAIGAPLDRGPTGVPEGAAYVFRLAGTTWQEEARLRSLDPELQDEFGWALDLGRERLVVGEHNDNNASGVNVGSALVYGRQGTTWTPWDKVIPTAAADHDQLGHSVALDGDTAIFGSNQLAQPCGGPVCSGLATVHVVSLKTTKLYCTAKTASHGCLPYLVVSGVPSVSSSDPFTIAGFDHFRGQAGVLIYGFSKLNMSFQGGTLCVKTPLSRAPTKTAKTLGSACANTGRLRQNFNKIVRGGSNPLLTAGQRITAQWIQRDPLNTIAGFSTNLSNAVQFEIEP